MLALPILAEPITGHSSGIADQPHFIHRLVTAHSEGTPVLTMTVSM